MVSDKDNGDIEWAAERRKAATPARIGVAGVPSGRGTERVSPSEIEK